MNKPHKHCELIKQWADGAIIEYKCDNGCWHYIGIPKWKPEVEYRIKPAEREIVPGDLILVWEWEEDEIGSAHSAIFTGEMLCNASGIEIDLAGPVRYGYRLHPKQLEIDVLREGYARLSTPTYVGATTKKVIDEILAKADEAGKG